VRTAFYHPSAVPPRDWLFFAALLWERIQVNDLLRHALSANPDYVASNPDAAMLLHLLRETSICTTDPPVVAQNLPEKEERPWIDYLEDANRALEKLLSQEELPPERRVVPSTEQLIRLSTLSNQMLLHDRFATVFANVDFFFAHGRSFVNDMPPTQHLLIRAVEAVVPLAPSQLSVAQLEEFRADTALQRQRCRELMTSELRRFEGVATEAEFVASLNHITEFLREQLALLEIRCRQYKVDVAKKVFGLTFAAPAALQVMGSVLAVPFLQPAAILATLSIAAADYLAAREKHHAELRSAPWAYLLSLKQQM